MNLIGEQSSMFFLGALKKSAGISSHWSINGDPKRTIAKKRQKNPRFWVGSSLAASFLVEGFPRCRFVFSPVILSLKSQGFSMYFPAKMRSYLEPQNPQNHRVGRYWVLVVFLIYTFLWFVF